MTWLLFPKTKMIIYHGDEVVCEIGKIFGEGKFLFDAADNDDALFDAADDDESLFDFTDDDDSLINADIVDAESNGVSPFVTHSP